MLNLLKALRQDEYGVILSAEIVIVGTVLVLGLLTGMVCLQKSVNSELGDFAKAIDCIDQSYSFAGYRKSNGYGMCGGCCASTAGSAFHNNECAADCRNDIVGCENQVMFNGNCGSCGNQCGSCGGACGTSGICGSCGYSGSIGFRNLNRPDCVSTGVPRMKVTEYPGTDNVPRTSNAGKSPIRFPELEAQPIGPVFQHVPPMCGEEFYPEPARHLDHPPVHGFRHPGHQEPGPPIREIGPGGHPSGPSFHSGFGPAEHREIPGVAPQQGPPVVDQESPRPVPENRPLPASPPEPME